MRWDNRMAPVFDNGDDIRYDRFIVINFSVHFSQKGGARMAMPNNLSRLQGIAQCYGLRTPPFEDA
jgi:hypothetical protein